jgi:hypothetical protein
MLKDIVLPALTVSLTRHLVGAAGAIGVVDGELEAKAAGAVGLLIAVGWSIFDRVKARRAARQE